MYYTTYFFLILIFLSINLSLNKKQTLILPYKIIQPFIYEKSTKEEIFLSLERNHFYTLFEIGNPPKKIPILYTFNNSCISFCSKLNFLCEIQPSYNPSKSESYKLFEQNKAKEDLYFNIDYQKIIKKFMFIDPSKKKKNINYYGYIGLQNFYKDYSKGSVGKTNFLYQLKELGLIDYMSFNINQTSKDGGFINFNLEPNEYAPNLYSELNNNKFKIDVKGIDSPLINKASGELLWSLDIDYVYYKNYEHKRVSLEVVTFDLKEQQYAALLNPAYGIILGPYSFKQSIEKDFFDEFIKTDNCFISKANKIFFYSCKSNSRNKLEEKFPPINFHLKESNYTFVLNFDDLFVEVNGILFFMIGYDNSVYLQDKFSQISEWVLGKPFCDKYQFSFDVEKNKISFYVNKNGYTSKKNITRAPIFNDKFIRKMLNTHLYMKEILPTKNLALIAMSMFIIFVSFFCILYSLRKNSAIHNIKGKSEADIKINNKKNYIELKESIEPKSTNQ